MKCCRLIGTAFENRCGVKTKGYQPRTYRSLCESDGLVDFTVSIAESDLRISACQDLTTKAHNVLQILRNNLEDYVLTDRKFLTSLSPISVPDDAPRIVKEMAYAGAVFGVGPMAAVAGAIAEDMARALSRFSDNVIVENGGDIYAINQSSITAGIYAGNSPLSMKLALEIKPNSEGISLCTSSGTVGHSLSFGNADAVTVIAKKGSIADAAATAIGNIVKSEVDIEQAIDYARKFEQILGLVIIVNNKVGFNGEIVKLVEL